MALRSSELRDALPDELRDSVKELNGGNVRLRLCRAGPALDLGGRVREGADVDGIVSSSEYDGRES